VLGKLWPVIGRATQVAKKEIFYLFPFGTACYLWGTLFINRHNQKSAQIAINRESKAIAEKKVRNRNLSSNRN
jgi:lysophosphatidate acyltransferase